MKNTLPSVLLSGLLLAAAPAAAHAVLLQSTPAKGSSVSAPATIDIVFSEEVTPTSSLTLWKAGTAVPVGTVTLAPNHSEISAAPAAPLVPGKYEVRWHNEASDDGHKMTGSFTFNVK